MKIKTRFAPSPTGSLHIGSVRTCLFNYLLTKQHNGTFVLRIEDTDKQRSTKEYEKDILEGLQWLGMQWDEGPGIGDDSKYYQSNRGELYKKEIQRMLDEGKAYYCFCTKEDLQGKRDYAQSRGKQYFYDKTCSNLSDEEVKNKLEAGEKYVIRFRTPDREVVYKDLILGEIKADAGLFGDFVIATSIDKPLYNLAAVIDDNEMEITHVIRGADHVPNTPKQVILAEELGYEKINYAHIPLILGPDKSKLSKRHNVHPISEYKEIGYLKESLVNFIAFLGWNPGGEEEIFSMEELVEIFKLERCGKSSSIFNVAKLDWYNGMYIRKMKISDLTDKCIPYLSEIIDGYDREYIEKAISLYQERLVLISEIPTLIDYLFKKELSYSKDILLWKDMTENDLQASLDKSYEILSKIDGVWDREVIQEILLKDLEMKRGYLLWPLRVSLSGKKASAGPFEIAEVLGKDETLKRIKYAQSL